MPQPTKGPRLGGSPAHQKLMLANLATSLFTHGRIHTTRAKAERLRPYAERLITKAKKGDLHNRREISTVIRDKDVVHRLIAEIGPFFADRPGGYTRIIKTLPRKGDNAPMAIIELVNEKLASTEASAATRSAATRQTEVGGTATGAAATAATIAAAESADTTADGAAAEESVGTDADTPVLAEEATTAESESGSSTTTTEVGGGSGATTDAGSTETTGSTETAADEVPEPMADNAADAAGLSTDDKKDGS